MKRQHGAFILARYSTDNQNPDTIEVQVDLCQKYCDEKHLPVLGVYADMAVSGMKDTRLQYAAMLQDLKNGMADTVIMYDQSRVFRKMIDWFLFRDKMAQNGVTVISVTQPMIGKDLRDPANFLAEGSMALFNQMWVLQTQQKTIEKMRWMANHGIHTGGKPALGYKVVDKRLVICEEEAVTVRRIFREYANGRSYRQIIEGLNADGIKTKRGVAFGTNSLHDLLHNEKYIGTLIYGASPYREDGTRNSHSKNGQNVIRIENAVPPIVDKDLFEEVQARMRINKKIQSGRPHTVRDYPLRGKVFCAECKSSMTISTSKGKIHYYTCTGKKRLHNCDATPIEAGYLERRVADAVRSILLAPGNKDHLMQIMRDQADILQGSAANRLQNLIQQKKQVKKQLDNAVSAVLNGLSSPSLADKIHALEAQKAQIEADMQRLKHSVDASTMPVSNLENIIDTIIHAGPGGDAAILSIVSRVEVGKDTITIWTLLDEDPPKNFDYNTDTAPDGVTITLGIPSGVPIKRHPLRVPFYWCARDSKD